MPTASPSSVDTIRAELRRVQYGPMLPRLWHGAMMRWQRASDQRTVRSGREQPEASAGLLSQPADEVPAL